MAAVNENGVGFIYNPKLPPVGAFTLMLDFDVDADYQSEANDRLNIPNSVMPEGRYFDLFMLFDNEAGDGHATPTLDADIVLVQGVDLPTDTGTETVIVNAGTRWQAASTTVVWYWANTYLDEKGYSGKAHLRWKCVAASATAVDGFNIRAAAFGH